jgi:hypothetical protein
VVVAAFQQALGLRVAGFADQHLGPQDPAERVTGGGQLRLRPPVPADRGLPVPHEHLGDSAELVQQGPPAGVQVLLGPGRDQQGAAPPGVTAGHRQHRQPLGRAGLAVPTSRVTGGNQKSNRDLLLEHRQAPGPPDTIGDHRRRHPRVLGQQRPDRLLIGVGHRPGRCPLVPRRRGRRQRPAHRHPRHPDPARDLRDRHSLRHVQPTDLCPLLHTDHPPQGRDRWIPFTRRSVDSLQPSPTPGCRSSPLGPGAPRGHQAPSRSLRLPGDLDARPCPWRRPARGDSRACTEAPWVRLYALEGLGGSGA